MKFEKQHKIISKVFFNVLESRSVALGSLFMNPFSTDPKFDTEKSWWSLYDYLLKFSFYGNSIIISYIETPFPFRGKRAIGSPFGGSNGKQKIAVCSSLKEQNQIFEKSSLIN